MGDQEIFCKIPAENEFVHQICSQNPCELPPACQDFSRTCKCTSCIDFCYEQPPRQQMCVPEDSYVRRTEPMDTNTIYKSSFIKNDGFKRAVPFHIQDHIKPFQGQMDGNTVQKLSFQPHCNVGRVQPIRPKLNAQRFGGTFYDITSQKHDFVPKCYSKRMPLKVADGILKFCAPLEKFTVNKLSYMPYDICKNLPPKPIIQTGSYVRPDAVSKEYSIQKLSYIPVPLPEKEDMPWARRVRVEPPRNGPLCTTYKLSFIPNCNPQRIPTIAPQQAIKIFGSEMADKNTVYKLSYIKSFGTKPGPNLPRPGIQLPTGRMEKCSVYKLSYPPQGCPERATPIRPKGNICMSNSPIKDITTQKHDFGPKPNCQRSIIVPPTSMSTPSCPIEKCTINKLSYLPQCNAVKIGPILPRPGLSKVDGPMAKCTTYKLSYLPVSIPPKVALPWAKQSSCTRKPAPMEKCTIQKLSYGAPGRFISKGNCGCCCKNKPAPATLYPKAAVCI